MEIVEFAFVAFIKWLEVCRVAVLIAQGNDPHHRWRRPVPPGERLLLGRSEGTLAVPWDKNVSRQHAEVRLVDDLLEVRRLPSARNAIMMRGRESDHFELRPGEQFLIGETTFTLVDERADLAPEVPDIPGYEVEAEIGRGGMGVVYRVRRLADDAVFALKMILFSRDASFAELARFRIEAEALACLNHPNIVKIRDVGVFAGYPFFAMEFAGRGSLKQSISRGPQKPRWAADLVRIVASAMQHAHERGILHRDLKPANVLLMEDGTPKVSDFGLVKFANPIRRVMESYCTFSVSVLDEELSRFGRELEAQYDPIDEASAVSEDEITRRTWEQCAARTRVLIDEERLHSVREFLSDARKQARREAPNLDGLTLSGAIMGSPNYMAPEQATGQLERIGPRTDVYALGAILYEMITGRPPFLSSGSMSYLLQQTCSEPPTPPRQFVPEVSADIEAVCLKCLEKSPDRRYQSAAELVEDLSRFLDGYTPGAVATSAAVPMPVTAAVPSDSPSSPPWVSQFVPETRQPNAPIPQTGRTATRGWWPFVRSRSDPSGGPP